MPREKHKGGQLKLLSDKDIDQIHAAALKILEETGIKVPSDEAFNIYRDGGASVESGQRTVRIPAKMVEKVLADSPAEIRLCGREEKNDLLLADKNVYAGTGGAELNVLDLETGRLRPGTLRDVADLARLVDALEHIDFYIRPVVARDVPKEELDINKYYASLAN
ncbi:unnamed protein product, partial [marine sediment metagenome]